MKISEVIKEVDFQEVWKYIETYYKDISKPKEVVFNIVTEFKNITPVTTMETEWVFCLGSVNILLLHHGNTTGGISSYIPYLRSKNSPLLDMKKYATSKKELYILELADVPWGDLLNIDIDDFNKDESPVVVLGEIIAAMFNENIYTEHDSIEYITHNTIKQLNDSMNDSVREYAY